MAEDVLGDFAEFDVAVLGVAAQDVERHVGADVEALHEDSDCLADEPSRFNRVHHRLAVTCLGDRYRCVLRQEGRDQEPFAAQ